MSNKTGSKKAIDGASQIGTVFSIEPDKLTRVTDAKSPLYDPRVHNTPAEWLINNIEQEGYDQTQIIILRKNGPLLEIVDGRHKHAAAMEVNRRRTTKYGDQAMLIKVPVLVKKGKSDLEYAQTMIITTYLRQNDSVMMAAEKLHDFMQKFGRGIEEAATTFGLSPATVKIYQKLVTELTDKVKQAVRDERISAHDAVKFFADMTHDNQDKNLESVIASSPKNAGKKDPTNPEGKKNKNDSPIARLRKIFRNEEAMSALSPRERTMLNWLYNKATMGDLMGSNPTLAEVLGKKKAKKIAEKKAKSGSHATFGPRVASATR